MTAYVEWSDVQGLVYSPYADAPHAYYCLLQVQDGGAARAWLAGLVKAPRVTLVDHRATRADRSRSRINVAFSCRGLQRLGLPEAGIATFGRAFQQDIGSPERARILGDRGEAAPDHWLWGGPYRPRADVLLMLFAPDLAELDELLVEERRAWSGALQEAYPPLHGYIEPQGAFAVEHFGFLDGVSQPSIDDGRERNADVPAADLIRAGEFLLGYPNELDQLPATPAVPAASDRGNHLLELAGTHGPLRDFGRNGTYLVMRQLSQDVAAFWNFIADRCGSARPAVQDALAAKLVGRWPNGVALVDSPHHPHARTVGNDFGYRVDDAGGLRCPVGAHIRRANPRDSLLADAADGRQIARHHRLLRRGRRYGQALKERNKDDGQSRGLHFIALNANLERQFEFLQQSWGNGRKFGGLRDEADPLLGNPGGGGSFTIPQQMLNRTLTGLPAFVLARGGGYFFLPGAGALHYLAAL